MSGVRERIQAVSERWFLTERLLFSAVISHHFAENRAMRCGLRSGKGLVEYNPDLLEPLNDLELDIALRIEALRILLKHPYQRQPMQAVPEIMALASDVTIFEHAFYGENPREALPLAGLPPKLSFEEYYNLLVRMFPSQTPTADGVAGSPQVAEQGEQSGVAPDGTSVGEGSDDGGSIGSESRENDSAEGESGLSDDVRRQLAELAALWEEDLFMEEKINDLIEQAMASRQWGSLPGSMQGLLKASIEKTLNVVRQLGLFRASILSTQRRLTRMRPSRRYGWSQMGVVHPYTTRLLIGIDTSGSVPTADLRRFFGIVNRFFAYGIPQIDVLQFDAAVRPPLLSLRKAAKDVVVTGRGGTDFQPLIDYFAEHREYDGLIVFTDGYAPVPVMPPGRRILWVLSDRRCYDACALSPKVYI